MTRSEAAARASASLDRRERLRIRDLHPVDPRDPNSTLFFYAVLAAVTIGFTGATQTASNAKRLTIVQEVGWGVARAALIGGIVPVVLGPLLQMQPLPFPSAWAVLTWTSWTAGTTYLLFRLLTGSAWAMAPTWLLFVAIGNPSSGGPIADPLLPSPLASIGRVLPAGAAINGLRDLTYFPADLHLQPFLALATWGIATTGGWLAVRAWRTKHPRPDKQPM